MYMRNGVWFSDGNVKMAALITRYDKDIESFAFENDLRYVKESEELIDCLISKGSFAMAYRVYMSLYGVDLSSAIHEVRKRKEKAENESAFEQAYQVLEKLL